MNTRTILIAIAIPVVLGSALYAAYTWSVHTTPALEHTVATSTPLLMATSTMATSTAPVATTSKPSIPTSKPISKPVKTTTVTTRTTTTVTTSPATTTPVVIAGTGNLTASLIPLLTGGNVRAGGIVPVSYLQITNVGTTSVRLSGFELNQRGSAPDVAIIGLQTVDEMGGSRGSVGGSEATTPFVNGVARVPTNAVLTPGKMKLFTIKVQLSAKAGQYAGSQIIIMVTGLEATATTRASFPIAGTTWTIIP